MLFEKEVSRMQAASGHHSVLLSQGSVNIEQSKQWQLNMFQE